MREAEQERETICESMQAEISRLTARCHELEDAVGQAHAAGSNREPASGSAQEAEMTCLLEENCMLRQQCVSFETELERMRNELPSAHDGSSPSNFELEELRAENAEL